MQLVGKLANLKGLLADWLDLLFKCFRLAFTVVLYWFVASSTNLPKYLKLWAHDTREMCHGRRLNFVVISENLEYVQSSKL